MKIKNKNIEIGDIVKVTEKYNEDYHFLKSDREIVGFVIGFELEQNHKLIIISYAKLQNYVRNNIEGFWKNLKEIPKNIGYANFDKRKYFYEKDIKSIEVLK